MFKNRWPNFSAGEIACKHCGEIYVSISVLDAAQKARDILGEPLVVNSGHRCSLHNARQGGAPLSQHLKLALDISTQGHDKKRLWQALKTAGFKGFGYYDSFLHVDMGRRRYWSQNEEVRLKWQAILST